MKKRSDESRQSRGYRGQPPNNPLSEEQMIAVLRRKAQKYLSTPGVTSVGVGHKIKDGKKTDELCIQFTVAQKLAPEILAAENIALLPAVITDDEGNQIPCDVVERRYEPSFKLVAEAGEATSRETRRRRQNPVLPGISVAHERETAGTVGAIVFDTTTGQAFVLSNWHVLQGPSGKIGDRVLQPGPFDGGGGSKSRLGRLVASHLGLAGDCAIASLEDRAFNTTVLDLNIVPARIAKVNLGDTVVKSGRTTEVTHGIVERVGVVVNINYGGSIGVRQIGGFEIHPNPDKPAPDGEISMGGDSGSLWLVDQEPDRDVAVGLHFAGEVDPAPEAEHALACNIHSVLEKLGVSFDPGAASGSECAMLRRQILLREGRSADEVTDPEEEPINLEQLAGLEAAFATDPQALLERFRIAAGSRLSLENLAFVLDEARIALEHPRDAARSLEARSVFERSSEGLPDGFTFEGMDLDRIPIDWRSKKFEPVGDALGWALFSGGVILSDPAKAPFRLDVGRGFEYRIDDPSEEHPLEIALFSDWGTGLYHSRYIARQFERRRFPYAVHLGDVYYAGRASEFRRYVAEPLTPILGDTGVFLLNSNHEMYSGGKHYYDFLDQKRVSHPNRQRQEGSYFSLRNQRCQIIGIDTAYHRNGRFREPALLEWLHRNLSEGRSNGQTNILLSANFPYEYGETGLTDLFSDLTAVIGDRVDLWFWGDSHYCALFDRGPETPFIGSCVGHGGYPYERKRLGERTPAPLLFLETAPRFPEWTRLRQSRGNNGYCTLTVKADGSFGLSYIDWMGNTRCIVSLSRVDSGKVRVNSVQPQPPSS